MLEFEVWDLNSSTPEDEGDDRSYVEVISSHTAREAAELYAEKMFERFEYPDSMELYIKQLPDGARQIFDVSVEPIPRFYASVRRQGGSNG